MKKAGARWHRRPEVAVVGAGWAGCAAAVVLARAGVRVTLFEQSSTLGGRARRVRLDGVRLDNGQHLLLGAYRQTLALIRRVHGGDHQPLFRRLPLTLQPFGAPRPGAVTFSVLRAPAPLHLAFGAFGARGLRLRERIALVTAFSRLVRAGGRRDDHDTVAQLLADTPLHALAALWEPLCLAALNTPPDAASARMFGRVVRAAFAGSSDNSDFLVPAMDLSALFPDAAARYVVRRGGTIRAGAAVRVTRAAHGVTVAGCERPSFDAAIVATGPHQLASALGKGAAADPAWRATLATVAAFSYEPITTIYVAYPEPLSLPFPMMRLDDAPGQWVFDRSGALERGTARGARSLFAIVISASGPHEALERDALAGEVDAQLRRLAGTWPWPLWSRVVAERRATYACRPGLARPLERRIAPRLYLAGDYTDPKFPATLEAATRSGVAAARALLEDLALVNA